MNNQHSIINQEYNAQNFVRQAGAASSFGELTPFRSELLSRQSNTLPMTCQVQSNKISDSDDDNNRVSAENGDMTRTYIHDMHLSQNQGKDTVLIHQSANDDHNDDSASDSYSLEKRANKIESPMYEAEFLEEEQRQKPVEIPEFTSEYETLIHIMTQKQKFATKPSFTKKDRVEFKSYDRKIWDQKNVQAQHQGRTSISFNIRIPTCFTFRQGMLQQMITQDSLGCLQVDDQVAFSDFEAHFRKSQRFYQRALPMAVFYRLPQNMVKGRMTPVNNNSILYKDVMSNQRFKQLLELKKIPNDVIFVQEIFFSADLTPPLLTNNPNAEPARNNSCRFTIFEVKWEANERKIHSIDLNPYEYEDQREYSNPSNGAFEITKLSNHVETTVVHVAQSKEQITTQMKLIKSMHGTQNASKVEKLKINMPTQLMHITHEQGFLMVEKEKIPNIDEIQRLKNQERDIFQSRRSSSPSKDANHYQLRPDLNFADSQQPDDLRKSFGQTNTSENGFYKGYMKLRKTVSIGEEMYDSCQTAFSLLQAQFHMNDLDLQKGTFYFQWVHNEKQQTRNPSKVVNKQLYLIYAENLKIQDYRLTKVYPMPVKKLHCFKDQLTSHLIKIIQEHTETRIKDKNHSKKCSCLIPLDLHEKSNKWCRNVSRALAFMDPQIFEKSNNGEFPDKVIRIFGYILGIEKQLENEIQTFKSQQSDSDTDNKTVTDQQKRIRKFFYNQQQTNKFQKTLPCPFCEAELMVDNQNSLPLEQLMFIPFQDKYLQNLGPKLPFKKREQVLLGNKHLPEFLRLTIPQVNTVLKFQELQSYSSWMNQQINFCSECFIQIKDLIFRFGLQSERLHKYQSQFQKDMLKMIKSSSQTNLGSQKQIQVVDPVFKKLCKQKNVTMRLSPLTNEEKSDVESDNQSSKIQSETISPKFLNSKFSQTFNGKISSDDQSKDLERKITGAKLALRKKLKPRNLAKKTTFEDQDPQEWLKKGNLEMSQAEIDQIMARVKEDFKISDKIQTSFRPTNTHSRQNSNYIQEELKIQQGAGIEISNNPIKQNIQEDSRKPVNISKFLEQSFNKQSRLGKSQSNFSQAGRHTTLSLKEKIFCDKKQKEKLYTAKMKHNLTMIGLRPGDTNLSNAKQMESDLNKSLSQPLFQPMPKLVSLRRSQPTISNLNQMKHNLANENIQMAQTGNYQDSQSKLRQLLSRNQGSRYLRNKGLHQTQTSNFLKRSKTALELQTSNNMSQQVKDDVDIVRQILRRDFPVEAKRLGDSQISSCGSQMSQQYKSKVKSVKDKARRKNLSKQIKQLRINQRLKNQQQLEQRVSLREQNYEIPEEDQFKIVSQEVPIEETRGWVYKKNLPELKAAQRIVQNDIRRAVDDPFFGTVNKKKILKTDIKIRDKDAEFRMGISRIPIKKKQTNAVAKNEDLGWQISEQSRKELLKEHNDIGDCEKLILDMDKCIKTNKVIRPSKTTKVGEFDITQRFAKVLGFKANSESLQSLADGTQSRKQILKALSLVKQLEQGERDIRNDERNLDKRIKLSQRIEKQEGRMHELQSIKDLQAVKNYRKMEMERELEDKETKLAEQVRQSLRSLKKIDKKVSKITRMLRPSKSMQRLHQGKSTQVSLNEQNLKDNKISSSAFRLDIPTGRSMRSLNLRQLLDI